MTAVGRIPDSKTYLTAAILESCISGEHLSVLLEGTGVHPASAAAGMGLLHVKCSSKVLQEKASGLLCVLLPSLLWGHGPFLLPCFSTFPNSLFCLKVVGQFLLLFLLLEQWTVFGFRKCHHELPRFLYLQIEGGKTAYLRPDWSSSFVYFFPDVLFLRLWRQKTHESYCLEVLEVSLYWDLKCWF